MKILHAADLHIDSPLRGLASYEGAPVDEIRGATRRAVQNLVDAAVSNSVDLVVIAGDIFDGEWKDYSTGLFWVKQLARLRDEEIPVVIVAGNHDAGSEITKRLTLPPNVTRLASSSPQTRRFDDLDLAVIGQSYAKKIVNDDLAARFPKPDHGLFNIGLLHTSLDGRPGHATYAPTSVEVLRGLGYQYWALGHVHQREVVSQEPWIVFPGNLQGRHIRETGPKGASLVTIEQGEVESVEDLELDVVRWANCFIEVKDSHTLGEVLTQVQKGLEIAVEAAQGRLVAARINLVGRSPIHNDLWRSSLELDMEIRALGTASNDLWIEKVKLNTRRTTEVDGGLIEAIRARAKGIQNDPDEMALVESLFSDLRSKLPSELSVSDPNDAYNSAPTSSDQLKASLDSAVDLIAALLSETEGL